MPFLQAVQRGIEPFGSSYKLMELSVSSGACPDDDIFVAEDNRPGAAAAGRALSAPIS